MKLFVALEGVRLTVLSESVSVSVKDYKFGAVALVRSEFMSIAQGNNNCKLKT